MKLAELQVNEFTRVLASDAPAPGGGSAAALEGALGAALTAMVCTLTAGKKQFAEQSEALLAVQAQAESLRARFLDVMDRDTEAFLVVSAAYAMPKSTDEEKSARSAAIQRALVGCTETPFEMMELAAETVELTASLLGRFNTSAASDLGVSALSLRAAVQGAWLNVLINIGSLKDRALAEQSRSRGAALVEQVLERADAVYQAVLTLV